MNRLTTSKRTQVIAALVEGVSINAIARMTGVSKVTILRLLEQMGCACAEYHNRAIHNLKVRRVQCDEIWASVYAKQKNVTEEQMAKGAGDCGYGSSQGLKPNYFMLSLNARLKPCSSAVL